MHPSNSRRSVTLSLLFLLAASILSAGTAEAQVAAGVANNRLSVLGTPAGDAIVLQLKAGDATKLEVLDGANLVGTFDRGAFLFIDVDALAGNDSITIDEVNGVFTDTHVTTLRGGLDADVIRGGAGPENIQGGPGNDDLSGSAGNDVIAGGTDRDTIVGGFGNDLIQWSDGDGNDEIDGAENDDALSIDSSENAENMVVTVTPAGRVVVTRDLGAVTIDFIGIEKTTVNLLGGNDRFNAEAAIGLTAKTSLTVNGGVGDDIIIGGDGPDALNGEDGADTLAGNGGEDVLRGGGGNDTLIGGPDNDIQDGGDQDDLFQWTVGDGSDSLEGGLGSDTLQFDGGPAANIFELTENGLRMRLVVQGTAFMDMGTTELLLLNMGAGNDTFRGQDVAAGRMNVTINAGDGEDVVFGTQGSDVIHGDAGGDFISGGDDVDVIDGGDGSDLLVGGRGNDTITGGAGADTMTWLPGEGSDKMDGEADIDTLQFDGSAGAEIMTLVVGANGRLTFTRDVGNITMNLATIEQLVVNAGGGNDRVTIAPGIQIIATINGGDGDDTLTGGDFGDTLNGDAGNDILNGGAGVDIMKGGDGNDTLVGGPGFDQQGGGTGDDRFIWRPGDSNDDVEGEAGVDTMQFDGFDGVDTIVAAPKPTGGGRVTLTRSPGNIVIDIGTTEKLEANGLGGNDTIAATGALRALIAVTFDGGDGDDTITGADGDDTLRGGPGADTLVGGAGVDTLDGGDGDDTLQGGPGNDPHLGGAGNDRMIWKPGDGSDLNEGGPGDDTLQFDGAAAAEIFTVSPNGSRVTFTRNVGTITMDVGTTEHLVVNGLGGDDTFTVNAGLGSLIAIAIDAGAGADTINTTASSPITVDGSTEADTLNLNAERRIAKKLQGSITANGQTVVTHVNIETINVTNDKPGATITITSPTADETTTATTLLITLGGTAEAEDGVKSVTWSSDRGSSGAATGTTTWTAANIPLLAGDNLITVTVDDTQGGRATDAITIVVNQLTYSLAEGATGPFFDTDILIANPNAAAAPVTITYLKGDGTTVTQQLTVAATSRATIAVDKVRGVEEASEVSATIVSTDALPLVVERTMRWDQTGYGAHTEKATLGAAPTWFFAEGSQGFFDTFLLLQNPAPTANEATVQFLREGLAPLVKTFALLPTSRRTVHIASIPEMVNTSFGMVVTFATPGVAERAMYFGNPLFNAGHESAGVTAPATDWFLAEGATGSFFTTFLLLANPGATDAQVTLTYLPADGRAVTKTRTLAAHARQSINVALEDATLASNAIATQVHADAPVLAERAMFWPGSPTAWYETHNSFGATTVATKWGLAEGRVGMAQAYQTFILLANASATEAADVTITFLRTNGTTIVKTFTVNPASRVNVRVDADVPELKNEEFGAIVEVTNGVGIFVERAMYADANGVTFAAGTNALATILP